MTTLTSTNPAKGFETINSIPISDKDSVHRAVEKARAAQPAWQALSIPERVKYFEKLKVVFEARVEEIAKMQSMEMGKPITESYSEVSKVFDRLKWHMENAETVLAPRILDTLDTHQTELHFEPFGVAAVIAPWNFPTSLFMTGTSMLLLAGNTVVLKHSEECALTSKLLAETFEEAGFPEGVFQCIFGDGTVGEMLLEEDVNFVSFTGSSKVGHAIYQKAAEKFIPVLLEMGGSSPGIIFSDADIQKTCDSVFAERFNNCGQICVALKRLFVHEDIVDTVVEELVKRADKQVIGDPLDEKTTLGPLAAKRQADLLEEQVEDARAKGATIVTGGKRPLGLEGAYYEPTIITDTTPDMRVIKEEVFGPALSVIPFKDEADALAQANGTEYGLSAFVYTEDKERAMRVAKALESGQVSINGCAYGTNRAPFGGYKKSGIGRTKGEFGYYSMTQMKVIAKPVG